MTAHEDPQFERVGGALWRDTGVHVVVLPPESGAQVLVLGGGGAAFWRVLDRPRTLREVQERLALDAVEAPQDRDLLACATQLDGLGAVRLTTSGPGAGP